MYFGKRIGVLGIRKKKVGGPFYCVVPPFLREERRWEERGRKLGEENFSNARGKTGRNEEF